jgi:hypothetical protein
MTLSQKNKQNHNSEEPQSHDTDMMNDQVRNLQCQVWGKVLAPGFRGCHFISTLYSGSPVFTGKVSGFLVIKAPEAWFTIKWNSKNA